jgi:hypothetical protein
MWAEPRTRVTVSPMVSRVRWGQAIVFGFAGATVVAAASTSGAIPEVA